MSGPTPPKTGTDKQPPPPEVKKGPGKTDDFVSAFVTAIREPPPHDPVGVLVAPAFSLGWYLRALTRKDDDAVVAAVGSGFTHLSGPEGVDFCRRQVQAGVTRLAKVVADAGLRPLGALDGTNRVDSASTLDVSAFATLSAVDARLGRAYHLAGQMLDLTAPERHDRSEEALKEQVAKPRVAPILAALDDLATAFPPHAGHAVRDSLRAWTETFWPAKAPANGAKKSRGAPHDPPAEGQPERDPWARLRRQGQIWRALLAGEKAGKDMLEIDDYLEAAKEASGRVRAVGRRFLRDFPVLVGIVVLLFVGGIALIVVLNDGAGAAAGAGAILASIGLSWKGVGGALGRLARQLEEPLWGAEMDHAITRAITLIRREDGARDASRERRHLADALSAARPAA